MLVCVTLVCGETKFNQPNLKGCLFLKQSLYEVGSKSLSQTTMLYPHPGSSSGGVLPWWNHSLHYMRDHASCLTPILQGRRVFLKVWWLDFLVIRVCYVSRSKTLKSWISKRSNGSILSTAIKRTYFTRAGITRILQGIESFVVKYWHWVKSEANIPKRLGILRALICLVFS